MALVHLCAKFSTGMQVAIHQSSYMAYKFLNIGSSNSKFTLKVFCGSYQNELTSLCIQKGRVLAGNPAVPTKLLLLPALVVCLVG